MKVCTDVLTPDTKLLAFSAPGNIVLQCMPIAEAATANNHRKTNARTKIVQNA
jgi:hypothetical protein